AKAAACASVWKKMPPLASSGTCSAKPASDAPKNINVSRKANDAARAGRRRRELVDARAEAYRHREPARKEKAGVGNRQAAGPSKISAVTLHN
ncbi:MAG TPA: hypothetical protein VMX79_09400, partial [bacterium]|nr:hypothetical protein [bacterium]